MSPKPIPLSPSQKSAKRPVTERPADKKRWTFSFRYWRQVDFFGLSESDAKWFVSVLERLGELSKISIDEFRANQQEKTAWRYHDIDWTRKNVPIQRADLNWVDSDYLTNDVEFPLFQFMISMALGRVVGFWDEQDVFNVVLLDPLHNIQPSKHFDYRVDSCYPLSCKYSSLLTEIDELKRIACTGTACPSYVALSKMPSTQHSYRVIIAKVDDDVLRLGYEIIQAGGAESFNALLMDSILLAAEGIRRGQC